MDPWISNPTVGGSSPPGRNETAGFEVRYDEPILAYHADKVWNGSSDLRLGSKSPVLFHERVELGLPTAASDSASLKLGSLWHTLRELGDDAFAERAVVAPAKYSTAGGELSTKPEAKAWLAEQEGKIVLTQGQSDTLGKMRERFLANAAAVQLDESAAVREPSIRWVGPYGMKLKCRPDLITTAGHLVDWKSTSEQYPLETFCWSVKKFDYGLAAALYEQGCTVAGLADPPMVFVVTSTIEPYETQVLTLPAAYMDYCRRRLDAVLRDIARRREEGDWLPVGYGRVNEITMPGFGGDRGFSPVE